MPEVPGRKVVRKEVRYDRYTEKLAEALMATGDFANEADMIRTAIQTLYSEYAAHLIPIVLQSRNMKIHTGLPDELEETVPVTRRKPGKSKAASKPEKKNR
jgi:Arc/MetJ-type ribon-helix-helix transcriptional regulator